MRVVLLYHFFAPAFVVSAVHFTQLAQGLTAVGHDVEAWPANRERRRPRRCLPSRGRIGRVRVRRCWRPALSQDSALGRVVNALWMLLHWIGRALTCRDVDVLVIGSDPPMSVVVARVWRALRPRVRIVHWSFDLYPDIAVRHGVLRGGSVADRALRRVSASGLRACDAIVDIGPCMRARTAGLAPDVRAETIVPWPIAEAADARPPDPATREALFGDARAVLLYAGHLGHAHDATPFLRLAEALRDEGVVVAFQRLGDRERDVRAAAGDAPNVRFLSPCSESELVVRLQTADFHLVSLRDGFDGMVVPSKFFAALAVGRPVIYAGPARSSVARWIDEHDVGVALEGREATDDVARVRAALARRASDPGWPARCLAVCRARFSRVAGIRAWDALLRSLERPATVSGPDRA